MKNKTPNINPESAAHAIETVKKAREAILKLAPAVLYAAVKAGLIKPTPPTQ